jgi:hypothetical protein
MGKVIVAIKHLGAALLVKAGFYLIISIILIWLMKWAEITKIFSWKYVVVLAVGMLLFSVMFKSYVPEKK